MLCNSPFMSQGVLQGNQQVPLLLQQSRVPSDPILDPGKDTVESAISHGEDCIFTLQKMSSDMKKKKDVADEGSDISASEKTRDTGEKKEQEKAKSNEKCNKNHELHQQKGEVSLGRINYSGGLMCHQSDDGIKITVSADTGRENDLTSAFLTGSKRDIPSAEAAVITAQTIVEQDLCERKTNKYENLHKCQDASKIIPTTVGSDIKWGEIVVKNDPIATLAE